MLISILCALISLIIAFDTLSDLKAANNVLESLGATTEIGFVAVYNLFLPVFLCIALAVIFGITANIAGELESTDSAIRNLNRRVEVDIPKKIKKDVMEEVQQLLARQNNDKA